MLKFNRLSLLILIFSIKIGSIMAQAPQATDYGPRKSLPTSPEVAMLGKFGDIPIGYYTGTADVSVPMYTIKEAGVEIPIVLRYHGSGIKVEDEASNVGLGWSLDPGGAIIKVIQGQEDPAIGDDLVRWDAAGYTYLKSLNPFGVYSDRRSQELWLCAPRNADSYDTFVGLERGEGQPDIFQFNFAGHSGKFFINPDTRKIKQLDQTEDIKFEGTFLNWKATTMDGNVFEFSDMETTNYNGIDDGNALGRSFKLTKITLYNGKTIQFEYQDGYYESMGYSESYHTEYPFWNDGAPRVEWNYTTTRHKIKMLSRIITDENIIEFNLEDRIDLKTQNGFGIAGAKKIASVDIKNAQSLKKLKSFVFDYDYFTAGETVPGYLTSHGSSLGAFAVSQVKRLKLLSVTEAGYNVSGIQELSQPYRFNYEESVNLPIKSSFSRDFWGYYNGKAGDKLIPDLSFFLNSNDPDYGQLPANAVGVVSGANRSPDSLKMKAGMLKKVTYPTGGYTEFEYQAHDFSNHIYPDMNNNANLLYVDVADHNRPDEQLSATFSISSAQTITFHAEITRGPNQSVTAYAMQDASVILKKILNGTTTVIQTWKITNAADNNTFENEGTVNFNQPIYFNYESGAQYVVSVSMPDELGEQSVFPNYGHVSCSFSYQQLAPKKNSFGGGLRVSGIKNYSANGTVASIKKITYRGTDNLSSGILMTPLKPLVKKPITAINRITDTNNGVLGAVEYKVMDVFFISSESAVPISSGAAGGPIGYSEVQEFELDQNGSAKGKKVYNYYNTASTYAPNVPEQSDPFNGKLARESVFAGNSSSPILETSYGYGHKDGPGYIEGATFMGVTVSNAFVGPDPCALGTPEYKQPEVERWMVHFYPIYSAWPVLDFKQTKQYFDGNIILTREDYNYNTKGQLAQISTTNSKQQSQVSKFTYPIDNPSNPFSAALIAKDRYNSLQKQTVSINGAQTEQTDFNYKLEDNQLVQGEIKRTVGANQPFTEVTFDKYLDYQTPYQFTQKSSPSCFLWSFNYKRPIAEIKNIDHTTLESIISLASIKAFAANPNPSQSDINTFLAPLRNASIAGQFQVNSFTYDESTGLGSQTDAKGMTTYYNYDALQRLKAIKDQNNNILKQTEYHYKN